VGGADGDVPEPAQVAEGELAEAVDLVVADAVVDGCRAVERLGLEQAGEDGGGGATVERPVWPAAVVVEAEGVELELQLSESGGRWLPAQEALEGLMQTFNLAAGLGVVGAGVLDRDAQALELEFEEDLAATGVAGEDGGVVAEEGGGEAELVGGRVEEVDTSAALRVRKVVERSSRPMRDR
jgi:hypothetical protein